MALREGLSWWHPEPGQVPLEDTTVGALLDGAVADSADTEAVVLSAYADIGRNLRWTYRELGERVDDLARAFLAAGVEPGDRVAVWAPNVPEWLVAEFAIAKVGAVMVTVNPTYRRAEVEHVLSDSGASICLFLPRFGELDLWSELAPLRSALPALRLLVALADPPDGVPGFEEFVSRGAAVTPAELATRAADVAAGDVVQIQYTSGTTGRPKGTELTHRGIVNNARQAAALWQVRSGDRWCNPLPLFHTAGCAMLALGVVAARATHLPLIRFDARRVLQTIESERCTIVETVPTILTALLDRQATVGADLSALRLVGTSGAPTPRDLGERCAAEWGAPLRVLYGSTEVSPTVSGTALDEPGDLGWTTVGKPLPWSEVRVVSPGTDEIVPVGTTGELEVRGYQVMAGYYGRPEATADAVTGDGWYRTGDLAQLDQDGYLRVVGRLRDVVIRGGENLYPAEIEETLREHPAVADAAVIGVPDTFFGEQACAVIVLREGAELTAEQLRGWARERMTHQKVPRHVVFTGELPQTASGKVQKFRLREFVVATLDEDKD